MARVCKRCGGPIEKYGVVYCSCKCSVEDRVGKKTGKTRNIICLSCGAIFQISVYLDRKYCSRRCYYDSNVGKGWSTEEDERLKILVATCPYMKTIIEELGKNQASIRNRCKTLGIVRPVHFLRLEYAAGGKRNKGKPRPDLAENAFCGSGPDNPFYGKKHSERTRKIISEKAKLAGTFRRLAKDPEFQRRRMKGLHAKPNQPELIVGGILDSLFSGEYSYTGDGTFIIDGLSPDYTNINGQKKVIEIFGETWHDPKLSPKPVSERATEKGRRKAFKRFGYEMLVIWSKEIYLGGEEQRQKLIEKIKEFHHG